MTTDKSNRELDVLLYGASGFTGKLTALELERRGLKFAISGRNEGRLQAMKGQLESNPEVLPLDVFDPGPLGKAVSRARVVLTCAGPFADLGKPVQDAALASGTHFVDVTGECHYMLDTYRRDQEARDAGVVLLNAAGFDVVPTDLCAWFACNGVDDVAQVDLAFGTSGAAITRGTMRSALGIMARGGLAYRDGDWVKEAPGRHGRGVPFPAPLGARHVVSVPWGDVVTAPRTTGARTVRVFTVSNLMAGLFLRAAGPMIPFLASSPLGRLMEGWIDGQAEGPSDAERERTRFTIYAESTCSQGMRQFATLEGKDPYGLTAVTASYLSQLLCRPDHGLSGALTPCQVANPEELLEELTKRGVEAMVPSSGGLPD